MSIAYIGIGSNLGNREENCERAIFLLEENGIRVINRSSKIETEPWGFKNQPRFINMVIEIETDIEPKELLNLLKKIEIEIGRRPSFRWGPRMIDLDLLLYGDLVIKTPELEIPHPGTYNRDFVLKPLTEIAPNKVHPVIKKSFKEILLQSCQNS
jgi:2-amino-4-hydroxy-6-hydroxymethyldihydropteridine diphosphokinase